MSKKNNDKSDDSAAPIRFNNANNNNIIFNSNHINSNVINLNNRNNSKVNINEIIKEDNPFYSTNIKINDTIYVFSISESRQFPNSMLIKIDELYGISPYFYYRVLDLNELKNISSSFLFCKNVSGALNTFKHYITQTNFPTSRKSYHDFNNDDWDYNAKDNRGFNPIYDNSDFGYGYRNNYEDNFINNNNNKKFDNEISAVKTGEEIRLNCKILLPSKDIDNFNISLFCIDIIFQIIYFIIIF